MSFETCWPKDGDESTGEIRTDVYCHIMEDNDNRQDSNSVVAILLSALEQYKMEYPHITNIILKSDNAGTHDIFDQVIPLW